MKDVDGYVREFFEAVRGNIIAHQEETLDGFDETSETACEYIRNSKYSKALKKIVNLTKSEYLRKIVHLGGNSDDYFFQVVDILEELGEISLYVQEGDRT